MQNPEFVTSPLPLRQLKAKYVSWVVDQYSGHKAHAARFLGITRVTLDTILAQADHPAQAHPRNTYVDLREQKCAS